MDTYFIIGLKQKGHGFPSKKFGFFFMVISLNFNVLNIKVLENSTSPKKVHWQWFRKINKGRTTLDAISHNHHLDSSKCQFPNEEAWNCLFLELCVLLVFFPTPYSQPYFQYLSTNLHPISFQLNLLQFEFNSIIFQFQIQFNSICMQCHWILSFKMELDFDIEINFFFINWLSLVVCRNKGPKFNYCQTWEAIMVHDWWDLLSFVPFLKSCLTTFLLFFLAHLFSLFPSDLLFPLITSSPFSSLCPLAHFLLLPPILSPILDIDLQKGHETSKKGHQIWVHLDAL